jgi:hypothetical protein
LPQEQFLGQVDRIAPTANSGTGFVTFPVVIVLTDGPLDQLLPGMTASAVFAEGEPTAAESESEAQAEETVSETASGENASDSATSDATDAEVDAESNSTGAGEADDTGDSAP